MSSSEYPSPFFTWCYASQQYIFDRDSDTHSETILVPWWPGSRADSKNRWPRQKPTRRDMMMPCVIALWEVREGSMLPRLSGDSETTLCDLNSNWLINPVNLIDGPHSFWIGEETCCIFPIHELILQFRKVASCSKQKPAFKLGSKGFLQDSDVPVFCAHAIFTQHRR